MTKDKTQSESICFENYKNGQSKNLPPHDKKEEKMCEPFFKVMKAGKERKAHKDKPIIYCSCFLNKVFLFMRVTLWWSVGWGRSN